MTACAPASFAFVIATVMPRSLKEPVGFAPSNFTCTSQPVSSERNSEWMSGVPPSRSVTTGVSGPIGMRSEYSTRIPRQTPFVPTAAAGTAVWMLMR